MWAAMKGYDELFALRGAAYDRAMHAFPDARRQEFLQAVERMKLAAGMVVADVVFNPVTTRFLREAAERGCRAVDGLGMLVNQGVIGVRFWTGIDPDPEVMRVALEKAMGV